MLFRNTSKPDLIVGEPKTAATIPPASSSAASPQVEVKVVVVLLGWFGAQLKHVMKYAELYEERGCHTISCVLDPRSIMTVDLDKIDELLRLVVQEASKWLRMAGTEGGGGGEVPLICHVFSNGGGIPLQRLERTLDRRRDGEIHDGMDDDWALVGRGLARGAEIFDSAPAYPDWDTFCAAVLAALPHSRLVAYLFLLSSYVYLQVVGLVMTLRGRDNYMKQYWDHFVTCRPYSAVQAYIYSTADPITKSDRLGELVSARRLRIGGGDETHILERKFDDTAHVQHIRLHREEYIAVMDQVLKIVTTGGGEK